MPSREADFKRREVKICSYKKKGGEGIRACGEKECITFIFTIRFFRNMFWGFSYSSRILIDAM